MSVTSNVSETTGNDVEFSSVECGSLVLCKRVELKPPARGLVLLL